MANITDFENITLETTPENRSETTFGNWSETTFGNWTETTFGNWSETKFETTTEKPGLGLKDVINNSFSQLFWSQLPAGRKLSRGIEENSCPILNANNTLSSLIPGWEGIPTNIIVNTILALIILFVLYFFIRKVYQTEKLINAEYIANEKSSDWIHFIYGKRSSKQSLLYTNKQIDRDHPNAYLPIVLHKHKYLIKGTDEEEGVNHINTNLYGIDSNADKENKSFDDNSPTIRTMSETTSGLTEEEEKEVSHLKSILFDDDSMETERSTFSAQDIIEAKQKPINPQFGNSKTFREWYRKYFFIKDKEIYERRGYDALQYLVFQRYLIYFLGSLTVICLSIILPINLYAGKLNSIPNTYYRRTTILNIKNESPLIYIHAVMTLFVIAMGIFLMKRFSRLIGERVKSVDKKILLIENIPKLKRNPIELKEFLLKKFPNVVIERITFVYNVNKLTSLMLSLWTSIEAKNYCRIYQRKYGERCEVRPYCLGNFRGILGCCRWYPKVDGLEYYTQEKKSLEEQIEEELKNTTANPERMAFVLFKNRIMAKNVLDHFQGKYCICYCVRYLWGRIFGHKSDDFNSWQWQVSFAPFPDDIDWSEITTSGCKGWSLNISMNILIAIIFMFLSTPTSALNIIKYFIGYQKPGEDFSQMNSDPLYLVFWSYVPTLGYTLMTSLLPAVIKILTTQIPHRTKSDYNHAIMYKSYIFLILMVLILPSLEIITVSQLFETELNAKYNQTTEGANKVRWSCLFPAENGPFFLNYVLTSAFVASATEVSRFAELASYILTLVLIARTTAEYVTARQNTKFEFYFGTYHPRILLLFTLIVTFSISNPLIAPIGLFYMSVKHLVDRYLIFHVYVPTKISQRIHSKAIVFVYYSLLFLLSQVYTHLAAMDYTIPSYIVGTALILHNLFAFIELIRDLYIFC